MRTVPALALAALLALGSCKQVGLAPNTADPDSIKVDPDARVEPAHVVVQHVLIAFDEVGLTGVTRSKAKAERVAENVLAAARGGRDFAELVRLYSDDPGDGIYRLANWGEPLVSENETERGRMVTGFHEKCFELEPGEIGVAPYHPTESKYGWHIIKRLE